MGLMRFMTSGAALALLLLASPVAGAGDRSCPLECREARRVCHRAAYAAYQGCQARCADAVQVAIERARAACRSQSLSPEACRALVREATQAASLTCRTDCWQVRGRALSRCGTAIEQCREACDDLDPVCAQECRTEALECRAEVGECTTACAADVRAGIQACRDQAEETCQVEGYLGCVREARREGWRCKEECHDTLDCGHALYECVQACPRDDDDDDDHDWHHRDRDDDDDDDD